MVNTMGKKKYLVSLVALSALALPFVYGCNSSDTNGGGRDNDSDVFVADEDTSGRIELSVASSSIPVGGTSSFSAFVYDASGAPVPNIRVVCDSEEGVAIIEPTTLVNPQSFYGPAYEMTDGYGHMSGVIGCEAPGSFRFMCRLPAGGAERKFVTVHCTGSGSAAWAGAAGGGLGGGVADTGSGETGHNLRISHITFSDGDSDDTDDIDIVDDSPCPTNGKKEPFTDTRAIFTVINDTDEDVVFSHFKFQITGCDSPVGETLSLIGDTPVEAGETKTFSSLILAASTKRGLGSPNQCDSGLEKFDVIVYGTTQSGDPVSVSASKTVDLHNVWRCKDS